MSRLELPIDDRPHTSQFKPSQRIPSSPLFASLLGIATVVLFFAWEGRQGFSLWDEGYLWYGVQRVMSGEVPLRDFQAYDPGRYFWSAILMQLTGSEGIMAVRYTLLPLQAGALAAALTWLATTVVRSQRKNVLHLFLCALTLIIWMVPRHKLFDISISIALVSMFACWIRRPSPVTYFFAGSTLGLIAYFGRNHGMYGAIASISIFVYLALRCNDWSSWFRGVLIFIIGCFIGYLPMFATMVFARGFTRAFIESIKFLFEIKATNLPLPIPWPWQVRFTSMPTSESLRNLIIGLFFVSTLVFSFLSAIYVLTARWLRKPAHPLLVACAFCAAPYAHYAFSRADSGHLAQGIFPTLIGILALTGSLSWSRRILITLPLCTASFFVMLPLHSGWQCMGARNCPLIAIGSDQIRVDRGTANDIATLQKLTHDFAPHGESFFVAPLLPGSYALFGIKAPTWEIYTAWNRSDAFQQKEIQQLQTAKPAFALIVDIPLDSRNELRYKNTHPLMERYIQDNYAPIKGYTNNPAYQIYRPRDIASP